METIIGVILWVTTGFFIGLSVMYWVYGEAYRKCTLVLERGKVIIENAIVKTSLKKSRVEWTPPKWEIIRALATLTEVALDGVDNHLKKGGDSLDAIRSLEGRVQQARRLHTEMCIEWDINLEPAPINNLYEKINERAYILCKAKKEEIYPKEITT